MEDKSTDTVISTSGYGEPTVTADGGYGFIFDLAEGGMCYNQQLRKFNKQATKWRILLVDDKNQILGVKDSDGNLYGLDLSILHTHKMKFNTGSDPAMYRLEIGLSKPEQVNDSFGMVSATFDIENDVLGLLDVELYSIATVSGKATIGARLSCGKTDLHADLATLMADPLLWTCETAAGASVVITAVTDNATAGGWDVAFTGTGIHSIGWASPATLAAAHVGESPSNGYESIAVEVTMP
jgi:hypothetical protein